MNEKTDSTKREQRANRASTIHRYVPAKAGEKHGHYVVRCSAPDRSRPLFHLDPSPKSPQARARALETGASITERLWSEGLGAVPRKPASRPTVTLADSEDAAAWFDLWIGHRERRGMTSTPENRSHYREHIEPVIPKHIRDWTPEDLRALCRALDTKVQAGELSWKSAANVWGTATKMCQDAAESKLEPLRVRRDNPAKGVLGPDRGAETAKQYLYPSEVLRFLACAAVPLEWRRTVALAVYLFPRAGELRMLRWDDVDLEHGTVHIHRSRDRNTGREKATKTGQARRFAIEPALLPLLRALHAEAEGRATVADLPSDRDLARGLRRWLLRAGVDRAELHASGRTSKAMTFHDLRATGLTWMAVRGDDAHKIKQRAGHTDFKTTEGYIREAEAVRAGFGDVFPTLPEAMLGASDSTGEKPPEPSGCDSSSDPKLSQKLSQTGQVSGIVAGRTGLEPGSERTNQHELGAISHSGSAAAVTDSDPKCPTRHDAVTARDSAPDVIELALAAAIERTTDPAALVALAGELRARREARAGVVDLASARRDRGAK